MSKGTPIVAIRIPAATQAEIRNAIRSANTSRVEEEYTLSSWILSAIRSKLAHVERSRQATVRRKGKPRRKASPSGVNTTEDVGADGIPGDRYEESGGIDADSLEDCHPL